METVLLIVVGFFAGTLGGMIGGGGLLTVPLLFILGLDSAEVVGTSSVAALTSCISALFVYGKSGKIRKKVSKIFMVLVIPASLIGSYLVLIMPSDSLKKYIAFAMLSCLPIILKNEEFGVKVKRITKKGYNLGFALYFLSMVNATMVPAGAALISAVILVSFMGFKFVTAHATSLPARVVALVISCSIFLYYGNIHIPYALILSAASFAGGHFGAKLAVKKGSKMVRYVFSFIVLFSTIEMILDMNGLMPH